MYDYINQDSISKLEYNPTLENIQAYNEGDDLKVNEIEELASNTIENTTISVMKKRLS